MKIKYYIYDYYKKTTPYQCQVYVMLILFYFSDFKYHICREEFNYRFPSAHRPINLFHKSERRVLIIL